MFNNFLKFSTYFTIHTLSVWATSSFWSCSFNLSSFLFLASYCFFLPSDLLALKSALARFTSIMHSCMSSFFLFILPCLNWIFLMDIVCLQLHVNHVSKIFVLLSKNYSCLKHLEVFRCFIHIKIETGEWN